MLAPVPDGMGQARPPVTSLSSVPPSLLTHFLSSSPTHILCTAIPFTRPPNVYCPSSILFIHSSTHPPNLPSIHPSIQVLICSLHPLLLCSIYPFICPSHQSFILPFFFSSLISPSFLSFSLSLSLPSLLPSFLPLHYPVIHPASLYLSENCLDHPAIYPTSYIFFILISISSPLSSLPPCFPSLCLPTGPFNRLTIYCLSVHPSIHPCIHPYFHTSRPPTFTEQTEPSLASMAP